jgi:hypothetical protein
MHEKLKINQVTEYCQYHHIVIRRDAFFGFEYSVFIYFWFINESIGSSVFTVRVIR